MPRKIKETRQLAFDELFRRPQTMSSIAIDYSFPERLANELSRQEAFNKHLYRPNTYLHKWWARRCGSTFRAILKQFAPDPERRDYYASGGLEGKIVLDPMMGGGTTLHEAIRLGANVIGVDYDRIGWFSQTECPQCAKTLDTQYTLHGLYKRCACGEVVQIDQYELRQEANCTLSIWPESWEISETPPARHKQAKKPRLITKVETICPACGQKYQELLDVPFYARYVPIAIVGKCPVHGVFFRSPGSADMERIRAADSQRGQLDFGRIEDFAVKNGPKSGDLLGRNINSYLDVYSSRQLLYLYHSIQLLNAYDGAAKLNLALLVSTSLEFNSLLCGYKGWFQRRPGAIRHVFALHAYAFPYTVAENNPVNQDKSSGNLQLLFHDRIVRGRKWAIAPIERKIDRHGNAQPIKIPGELDGGVEVFDQAALASGRQAFRLIHGDSRRLPIDDHSVDFIVTDPPYYDNVQYSDLAAFFRVWLARLLPAHVDWVYDETSSAVATKSAEDDTGFIAAISGIFIECARVLKRKTGRMVFTFHHWDPNAWAELTIALQNAGFRLVNAYTVFSEHPISVHINNLNSIKHDTILVLALDGRVSAGRWQPPQVISTSDSETFCRQCSALLGWLLDGKHSQAAIRQTWKTLVQGEKPNGSQRR